MSPDLDTLLSEGRWNELARELSASTDPVHSARGIEVIRCAGELAARGWGPFTDTARAATLLPDAAHPASSALAAQAVRCLAHVGAALTAQTLLDAARARAPDDAGLAFAAEQLASGRAEGATRDEWLVLGLVDAGTLDEAIARLEALTSDATHRLFAFRLLADLRRRTLDFGAAADALEGALAARPNADDAPAFAFAAALARWSAGEVAAATSALRKLRDETLDARGSRGWVHARVVRMLDALDRDPDARDGGPTWLAIDPMPPLARSSDPSGIGVLRMISAAMTGALARSDRRLQDQGDGPAAIDVATGPIVTMPHLRRALRTRGMSTLRVVASEESIASVLEEGALMVLEEERPVATGFLIVRGIERVAGLLLLRDAERPGPFLRDVDEQWARSGLYGRSALVVLGHCDDRGDDGDDAKALRARLLARGVTHDAALDAVDRLDLDDAGRAPGQARVVELAHEAMRVASDFAIPHTRLGDALLAQRARGVLPRGTYERWFVEARERFPDAEWPLQIHARALGADGRHEEAGIAWSDAAGIDPHDFRNVLGMARACVFLGKNGDADRFYARACALCPRDARILAERADLALVRGDREHARLLAQIAVDIGPGDERALLVRATVLEGDDELEGANEMLARAAALDERNLAPRLRLVRRSLHAGSFDDAMKRGHALTVSEPGDAEVWVAATQAAFATADADWMLNAALSGIGRCGPHGPLVDAAARAIALLLPDERLEDAIDELTRTLAQVPSAMLDAASELARLHATDLAQMMSAAAIRAMPGNPNGTWRTAQLLLADRETRESRRDEIVELLNATIERAGPYPHPRVLLGLLLVDESPERAIALADGADSRAAPALVWTLYARAFAAAGRTEDAARVLSRIPELYPDGVLEPAGFLRYTRFGDAAVALLRGSLSALPDHVPTMVELARVLTAVDENDEALSLVQRAESIDASGAPRSVVLDIAQAARAWPALERAARAEVDEGVRDSGRGFRDVWPARARFAGARLASGDEDAHKTVLAHAPHHPGVLLTLARIERAMEHPHRQADEDALARVAPGAAARRLVERGNW